MSEPSLLFESTAHYYARFRPPYPASMFEHLRGHFGLEAGDRVLDVGTGTGLVATALAAMGCEVTGVDPDAAMLREARSAAERSGVSASVTLSVGRGEDLLGLVTGSFRLATFGASFHWMDRDLVLAHCEKLVEPGGGIAVISGGATMPGDAAGTKPLWATVVSETIAEFLGPRRMAGPGFYAHPTERHEAVVARSAFGDVHIWKTTVEIVRNVDELIGLQYSTSYCSPRLLGPRRSEFERVLRGRLLDANPDGRFVEVHDVEAICGERPRGPSA